VLRGELAMFSRSKDSVIEDDENKPLEDTTSQVQISWKAAIDHSKRITLINGGLVVVIMALSFQILMTKPVAIATPPNYSEPIQMIGNQANAAYKKQWGIFVANMLGNVNLRNVDIVLDTMKSMLSLSDYDALNEQVSGLVKALDIRDQYQQYTVLDVFYDNKYDKVIIYGERKLVDRKKRSSEDDSSRPVRWTYELTVISANGTPKLTTIDQYEGAPQLERNRIER
jgi:conjugal transfer pilus assembly protein TraE